MIEEQTLLFEEESIGRERIITDNNSVPDEFFCSICRCLLWKPRSCTSCQNLFCNKCIRTWLKINPISCPFHCSPYEEKRAPPYIHSLLARLSIRCRNSSFGCTEILSYDLLAQHESIECDFPTRRCHVCEQLILIKDIDLHEANCRPVFVNCSICEYPIKQILLEHHYKECFQQSINQLLQQHTPPTNEDEIIADNTVAIPERPINENLFNQFTAQLNQPNFTVPTANFVGIEMFNQARQGSRFARFWTTLRLILFNLSMIPSIFVILLFHGIGCVTGLSIALPIYVQTCMFTHIYRTIVFVVIFSGLFSFGLPLLLASMNDTSIIIFISFCLILWSSMSPYLQLNNLPMHTDPIELMKLYLIIFLILKLPLLIVRFWLWCIPPYISASCLAWITIYITFHIRRYINNFQSNVPMINNNIVEDVAHY